MIRTHVIAGLLATAMLAAPARVGTTDFDQFGTERSRSAPGRCAFRRTTPPL